MPINSIELFRLLQLTSPSLPTGGFSYSQGLEWAIECGWVTNEQETVSWLESILENNFQELEVPIFKRLYLAALEDDIDLFKYWCTRIYVSRETKELRAEETNRGRAMVRLLKDLEIETSSSWLQSATKCQVAAFALGCARWQIGINNSGAGLIWSWLENMVMVAIKTVPLGQTAGQQILARLTHNCSKCLAVGMKLQDHEIGGSTPVIAIASSLHETQYTRLYRS